MPTDDALDDALDDGGRTTLAALWSPLLAVTTVHAGRANGQIAMAGLSASILPEAPRVLIALWKANYTHDLILASGVFAVHLLPSAPESALFGALEIVRALGFSSGRDGEKLAGVRWTAGATGSPVLAAVYSHVEARVAATLDGGEMTIFVGDVMGGGAHSFDGPPLTWATARAKLPPEWLAEHEANQQRQRAAARGLRGLPG